MTRHVTPLHYCRQRKTLKKTSFLPVCLSSSCWHFAKIAPSGNVFLLQERLLFFHPQKKTSHPRWEGDTIAVILLHINIPWPMIASEKPPSILHDKEVACMWLNASELGNRREVHLHNRTKNKPKQKYLSTSPPPPTKKCTSPRTITSHGARSIKTVSHVHRYTHRPNTRASALEQCVAKKEGKNKQGKNANSTTVRVNAIGAMGTKKIRIRIEVKTKPVRKNRSGS